MRIEAGGHGVADKDIERRYYESITNLIKILPICDIVEIYDNSSKLTKIAIFNFGKVKYLSEDIPKWFNENFLDKINI